MIGQAGDLCRRCALGGPAEDENRDAGFARETASQLGEIGGGPVLGGPEGATGVQANQPLIRRQAQLVPGPIGCRFVAGGGCQLELDRAAPASQHAGQGQVVLHDGGGKQLARRVAGRLQSVSQEHPSAVSNVTDATRNSGHPGDPGCAKRVRQQDRNVVSHLAKETGNRVSPLLASVRTMMKQDRLVEPVTFRREPVPRAAG